MMRSLLFVPGDSPRKFEKALGTRADVLVLDLEDSVAGPAKVAARATVVAMLDADRRGKRLAVRVNALDTGLTLDDLAAVMPGRPDIVMLPKSGGGADVVQMGHYLSAFEAAFGLPQGATGILPIVTETPDAVLDLATYRPDPRLAGLMWGAEDLAAAIGAPANYDGQSYAAPFLLARNLCLMAAARAGVPAIDAVSPDVGDLDRVQSEARQARRDGFTAKAVIHPSHIDHVHAAFMPDAGEIDWAQRVLAALAAGAGPGVVTVDGRMVDKPHERMARRILEAAR